MRQRSGWQSGISSLVRLAAMIPASLAAATASPFGSSESREAVSGATRSVASARSHDGARAASLPDVDHPDLTGLVQVRARSRPRKYRCPEASVRLAAGSSIPLGPMDRETRLEENEKLFREVNERVEQMQDGLLGARIRSGSASAATRPASTR